MVPIGANTCEGGELFTRQALEGELVKKGYELERTASVVETAQVPNANFCTIRLVAQCVRYGC